MQAVTIINRTINIIQRAAAGLTLGSFTTERDYSHKHTLSLPLCNIEGASGALDKPPGSLEPSLVACLRFVYVELVIRNGCSYEQVLATFVSVGCPRQNRNVVADSLASSMLAVATALGSNPPYPKKKDPYQLS